MFSSQIKIMGMHGENSIFKPHFQVESVANEDPKDFSTDDRERKWLDQVSKVHPIEVAIHAAVRTYSVVTSKIHKARD